MQRIESIDDPRVAVYRNLRDRTLRGERIFVAEGALLTHRLLASPFEVESVFAADEFADEFRPLVDERVPFYVASEELLVDVVGYKFHRGVLAAGRRPAPLSVPQLIERIAKPEGFSLVVLPEAVQQENLGLIIRSAAALGIDGLLLGPRCCDPLNRRIMRLSMGGVLQVPLSKSTDLPADLHWLKTQHGVQFLAAVLDDRADPLSAVAWPKNVGLVFGNEYTGLGEDWLAVCDQLVTIPMQPNTDSLNLGVAAGIFMYELKRATPKR